MKGFYQAFVKPAVFRLSADSAHHMVSTGLRVVGATPPVRAVARTLFTFEHPALQQTIAGVFFPGPVGLSAGFDPNGLQAPVYRSMGFGWAEIGSVTRHPQNGNPPPHYGRLVADRSLIVNKGLKNEGVEAVVSRLKKMKEQQQIDYPLGISIARTSAIPDDQTASDYLQSYHIARTIADIITINVSCPNVACFTPEIQITFIKEIISRLKEARRAEEKRGFPPIPIWIKIGPDHDEKTIDEILSTILDGNLDGIVLTNLIKDRSKVRFSETPLMAKGGISGKLLHPFALSTLQTVARKTRGRIPLIAVGGVMSANDAYERIRSGASLIQLITGWVFEGPTLLREISQGLLQLLRRDGFERIEDAIGVDIPSS